MIKEIGEQKLTRNLIEISNLVTILQQKISPHQKTKITVLFYFILLLINVYYHLWLRTIISYI